MRISPRVICAWCRRNISGDHVAEPSHTLCEECFPRLMANPKGSLEDIVDDGVWVEIGLESLRDLMPRRSGSS